MKEKRIVETDSQNRSHKDKPAVFRLVNEATSPQEVLLPFYFDESYFTNPQGSEKHNAQLATMSFILAYSAFSHFREGEERYQNQDADLCYLLTGKAWSGKYVYNTYKSYETATLGFGHYQENKYYHEKSTEDSIAYSFAAKQMSFGILVCVVIRGGGYENEWCSNFNVGESANEKNYHKGFEVASNDIIKNLIGYLGSYDGQTIKLWIVGYSRGGAVANITAHKIKANNSFKNLEIKDQDIYTYAFEPPTGITSNNPEFKHLGIHNHINYLDLVTRFSLKSWNFISVGKNYTFPKVTDDGFQAHWNLVVKCMRQFIKQEPGQYSDISLDKLYPETIDKAENMLNASLKTPKELTNFYKQLSYLIQWVMSLNSEEIKKLQEIGNINLLFIAIQNLCEGKEELAKKNLKIFLHAVCPKRSEKHDDIIANFCALEELFILLTKSPDFIFLLFSCAIIPWTHSPILCLSWLMSQDSNYSSKVSEITIEPVEPSQSAKQLSSLIAELESCNDWSAQEEIIANWLSRHS